jgi:hypothetical protein
MSFHTIYKKSSEAEGVAVAKVLSPNLSIEPGVYSGGLLSILDEELAKTILLDWRWLLGQDAAALAVSALGELVFWSPKHGSVYFLEVQRGSSTFIDKKIDYVFDQFLTKEGVRDGVLHQKLVASLQNRLGLLQYGQCFIAEPWQMLGGSGSEASYVQGDLAVYLSLVGQTVKKDMDKRRAARKQQ